MISRLQIRTHHEVKDPVSGSGESVGGSTDTQGNDLGGVEPGHAEPANSEEGVEDEEEDNTSDLASVGALGVNSSEDSHRSSLTNSAKKHELTATDALDEEDRRPRSNEVLSTVESSQQMGHEAGHAEVGVDDGGVVGDEVDTANLLEHLVDVAEGGTVEVAVLVHGEEVAEASLGHLFDRLLHDNVFVLAVLIILGQVGDGGDDFLGLLVAVLENQPARRLGQVPDKGQDEETEENLQSQRETPCDGAGSE